MTSPGFANDSHNRRRPSGPPGLVLAAALLVAIAIPGTASAQGTAGALFPEPFVVEHHLVQTDDDGSRFQTEPVTDYYGGSWIVSVRPDGSRRIVDLARREVTEVQPDRGTYWSLSFDRLGALTARLADLATARTREARGESGVDEPRRAGAGSSVGASASAAARAGAELGDAGGAAGPPPLVVQELSAGELPAAPSARAGSRVGGDRAGDTAPAYRPGVTHLRVVEETRAEEPEAGMEVWLDPSVRLRPAALDAMAAFESAVLAPAARAGRGDTAGREGASAPSASAEARAARPATAGEKLAAARAHAAGAVPVRTVRTLAGPRSGEPAGTLEDRVTRLERLDALPLELVEIPEGLRRVPHPAEALVPFMEDELELDRAMSGERVMSGQQVGRTVTGGGER